MWTREWLAAVGVFTCPGKTINSAVVGVACMVFGDVLALSFNFVFVSFIL